MACATSSALRSASSRSRQGSSVWSMRVEHSVPRSGARRPVPRRSGSPAMARCYALARQPGTGRSFGPFVASASSHPRRVRRAAGSGRRRAGRRRADHAAVERPARHELHGGDGRPGDHDLVLRRARDLGRAGAGGGTADPRVGVRAGGRPHRRGRGLLRLPGLLPRRTRRAGQHRCDLRGHRAVRQQRRARHADRADAGRAGQPACLGAAAGGQAAAAARAADRGRALAGRVRTCSSAPPRRPAGSCWPRPRRRHEGRLPGPVARAGRLGGRELLLGGGPDGSGRDRHLRERPDRVRVRPRARRRRAALAAAPGRLRLLRGQQPDPTDAPSYKLALPGHTAGHGHERHAERGHRSARIAAARRFRST